MGQLLQEEALECGRSGEISALDRLSMCLIKLGRPEEAANRARSYFDLYRLDQGTKTAERITKRIEKALARRKREAQGDTGGDQSG